MLVRPLSFAILTSLALWLPTPSWAGERVSGPLGSLTVRDATVLGDRCGQVAYVWEGSGSSLNWTQSSWMVMLYEGENFTPYDAGYNAIDSASGTAPWVSGIDDFPAFKGSVEVCDKADTTKTYSLYSWSDDPQELRQVAHAAVNYIPVQVTTRTKPDAIRVKVSRDGRAWAGVRITAVRGDLTVGRLKANARGVATLDTRKLKASKRPVRFLVGTKASPIALSKKVTLPR